VRELHDADLGRRVLVKYATLCALGTVDEVVGWFCVKIRRYEERKKANGMMGQMKEA
jgi:hypothetical protein